MKKYVILSVMMYVFVLNSFAQTYILCEKWVDCGNNVQLLDPYYSPGVSFKWTGSSKNGKADGYGVAIKYQNGEFESKYEGTYKNGVREGKGIFTHADGTERQGTFVNGQLIGEGTMTSEDGQTYEGNFLNYRLHGKGKVKWGNGSTFEGYFVSDSPYTGKFTNYDGIVAYIQKGIPVEKINEPKSKYSPKIGKRITEYFDENWNRCVAKDAAYYRLITYNAQNKPKGKIKDYYISGELQSEYTAIFVDYDDEGKNFYEGEAKWYYKSGKISQKRYYLNNKLNGTQIAYYEDGAISLEQFYNNGTLDGDVISYYQNGSPAIIAKYNKGELKNNKYLQITEDGACFLVYEEDFNKNEDKWIYQGQNGSIVVAPNNYIVLNAAPGRTISGGIDTQFSQNNKNIIGIKVSPNSEPTSAVGVLFGFKDWYNYCAIYLRQNQFMFRYIKDGQQMTNETWKMARSINTDDVNEISIINAGESLTININDVEVWKSQGLRYEGSFCGVTANNNGIGDAFVCAADLKVYEAITDKQSIQEYMPRQKLKEGEWAGNGSGFFISEDGYLATNYHVVDGATDIEVTFVRDGKQESYPASIVMSDKQNDLSILKVNNESFKSLPPIPYNFMTKIKDTGSEVFTLGYPIASVMGEEVKFTDGKISSKTGIQGDVTVYQISVPIQPGNSGGPLFDNLGNVVGITSSGLNRDYFKSENVNYAIKSSYLKSLVDALPKQIELQTGADIANLPLTEKIKKFQTYMIYIKVR